MDFGIFKSELKQFLFKIYTQFLELLNSVGQFLEVYLFSIRS